MAFSLNNTAITELTDAGVADFASGLVPMSNLLRRAAESSRQTAAKDAKFFKTLLYYFELRVPTSLSTPSSYLYPLVLPPESYRLSEPFQVNRSYTNGGGLFVEEQGIVGRELTLSGTTGWAPRKGQRPTSDFSAIPTPKQRTWKRDTTKVTKALTALSGQRHFQFLQDTVFRTYADLKQDPATSEGTELFFHNVRDDEHWRIIPLSFDVERSAGSPLLYNYSIQMLAVEAVNPTEIKASEDRPVLEALKDKFRTLRYAVDLIRASVSDLSAVTGELRLIHGGFVSLLDGAVGIADATASFLEGTATLIAMPFNDVLNVIKAGNDALLEWNTGRETNSAVGAPANLLNSIRRVIDAVSMIASYPEQFRNSVQAEVEKFQRQMNLATSRNASTLRSAQSRVLLSISDFESSALGTGSLPGDYARSQTTLGLGTATPKYQSAVEYILAQGDTLPNLAARFLNDARNWKYIALFNGLRPPFLSDNRIPGTLGVGDRILIPSFAAPPSVQTNTATFGVRPGESGEVHTLGRDLLLADSGSRDQYDLVVDTTNGSTDIKTVSGIPNLSQAMQVRVRTEQGTDILYRNLGCARVVGLGVTEVDLETAKIRLSDAIAADPRIAAVTGIEFTLDQPDSVVADVTAEVRGFVRPEQVVVVVPVV